MNKYELFENRVKEVAEAFRKIDKKEHIRVVSHFDSDGICSNAILIKALMRQGIKYSVSIVQHLNNEFFNEIAEEEYKYYFFTDLGSGSLTKIENYLNEKTVFILDHHHIEKKTIEKNIHHINPHCFGINGSKEISGAGVTFLFAKELEVKNEDLAYLAVIGALGDAQENGDCFMKMNQNITEMAEKNGSLQVKNELKIFGRETKPLVKILEHLTDPFIPGVSGSEKGAIKFLKDIGINPNKGKNRRMITDLSAVEEKKLNKAIISKRLEEDIVGDIFGQSFILCNERKGSPFRDAREFSTLLNACGRLNKSSTGTGACLGVAKIKDQALKVLNTYKKEVTNMMNWYYSNKNQNSVMENNGYVIINAKKGQDVAENIERIRNLL